MRKPRRILACRFHGLLAGFELSTYCTRPTGATRGIQYDGEAAAKFGRMRSDQYLAAQPRDFGQGFVEVGHADDAEPVGFPVFAIGRRGDAAARLSFAREDKITFPVGIGFRRDIESEGAVIEIPTNPFRGSSRRVRTSSIRLAAARRRESRRNSIGEGRSGCRPCPRRSPGARGRVSFRDRAWTVPPNRLVTASRVGGDVRHREIADPAGRVVYRLLTERGARPATGLPSLLNTV